MAQLGANVTLSYWLYWPWLSFALPRVTTSPEGSQSHGPALSKGSTVPM